jgi:hypothetical protein
VQQWRRRIGGEFRLFGHCSASKDIPHAVREAIHDMRLAVASSLPVCSSPKQGFVPDRPIQSGSASDQYQPCTVSEKER